MKTLMAVVCMAALAGSSCPPPASGQTAQHNDGPSEKVTSPQAWQTHSNKYESVPSASTETVVDSPAAGPEKEISREMQIINRSTTSCTTIAMQSPYQSGSKGAALINAAMTRCPWHGPPQPYDEYVKAILAGAREFQKTHPDAN